MRTGAQEEGLDSHCVRITRYCRGKVDSRSWRSPFGTLQTKTIKVIDGPPEFDRFAR